MVQRIRENYLLIIYGCILFCIHIVFLPLLNGIIFGDELGYWGSVAFITGKDWSEVLSSLSYYSYTYGIWFIIPMMIGLSSSVLYKIAVLFNVACNIASFLVAYKVGKEIFSQLNKKEMGTIAFLISLYSGMLASALANWTESLLVLLYWSSIYCLLKIVKRPSYLNVSIFNLIICYAFAVHLRFVGVLLSGIVILILLFILKKIRFKYIVCAVGILLICCTLHMVIQNIVVDKVFLNNEMVANNDFSGSTSRIAQLLSVEGIYNFINSFLGKVAYTAVATCLMGILGFQKIAIMVFTSVKNIYRTKRTVSNSYIYMYIFLCSVSMILISAIYISNSTNRGYLFYGRYIEVVFGPLLLIGIAYFVQKKFKISTFFINFIGLFIVSFFLKDTLSGIDPNEGGIWATGMAPFFTSLNTQSTVIFFAVGTAMAVFFSIVLIYILWPCKFEKAFSAGKYIVLLVVLGSFWLYTFAFLVSNWMVPKQNNVDSNSSFIIDFVNELNIDSPIMVISDDSEFPWELQFRLQNNKIFVDTSFDEVPNIVYSDQQEYIVDNIEYYMYTSPESMYNIFLNPDYAEIIHANTYKNKIELEENEDSKEGYIYYGPYITLQRGNYEVVFELQYKLGGEQLGYCDISINNGQTIIKKVALTKDMFEDDQTTVSIPFSLHESTTGIEFRINLNPDVSVTLNDVYYLQDLNSYTVGLGNTAEIEKIADDVVRFNLSLEVIYMNSGEEKIDLSCLESLLNGYQFSVRSLEEIESFPKMEGHYIVADKNSMEWFDLLPDYIILQQYEQHILLASKDVVPKETQTLSNGNYADLSLIQNKSANSYVSGIYNLRDGGEYEVILKLQDEDDISELCVQALTDETVIEEVYESEYKDEIAVRFHSSVPIYNLNFRIYSTSTKKELNYVGGQIARIRDRITYIYDEQLKPLLDIADMLPNTDGVVSILTRGWNLDEREGIKKYLGEQNVKLCKYMESQDMNSNDITRCVNKDNSEVVEISFPDTNWLITSTDVSLIYDLMTEYTVVERTDWYALLVRHNYASLLQEKGIELLSDQMYLSLDFYNEVTETSALNRNISIPGGTYKVMFEVIPNSDELEEEEFGVQVWSGNNKYKFYQLNGKQDSIILSSQKGISNLRFEFLENVPGKLVANVLGICKLSDAYEIDLRKMKSYHGIYNDETSSIATSQDTIYGPYINMETGNYRIEFFYNTDSPKNLLFDVSANGGMIIMDSSNIMSERTEDGYKIALELSTEVELEQVEFRVHVPDGVEIELKSIIVSQEQ